MERSFGIKNSEVVQIAPFDQPLREQQNHKGHEGHKRRSVCCAVVEGHEKVEHGFPC